ncbi:MAG: DUF3597 domain-containing protein [Acidobacteriota bacterium]
MGMFSDLMGKIFHHSANAERPYDAAPPASFTPTPGVQPSPTAQATPPAGSVDVAAIFDKLAAEHTAEKLDWKHSIVDMMKLLGMDSSLSARKDLASDLHYSGDMNDSASMNMWLHKEVMRKIAENGGKVPDDVMHH